MQIQKTKKGFTLTEILITLSIVGVIAVMVIPSLYGQFQKKAYVGQLQKSYNILDNAIQEVIVDENAMDLAGTYLNVNRNANGVTKFFSDNFKTGAVCEAGNLTNCIGPKYRNLDKSEATFPTNAKCIVLNTGQTLCMKAVTPDAEGKMLDVYIDVNGPKGPNVFGRDAYILKVGVNGKVGEYVGAGNAGLDPETCNDNSSYGRGCFTRIMVKGWNMDY